MSALILMVVGLGCRKPETGLRVEISLNDLKVDQLEFTVQNTLGVPVNSIRRPMNADGVLADNQIVEIYLTFEPQHVNVTCIVVGLLHGLPEAMDQENVTLAQDELVPVKIMLGTAKDAGTDAEHPDAGHDGAPDADAAGDAMGAAADLGAGVVGDGAKDVGLDAPADGPSTM